ncbi:hypothetical protein EVJ50_01665 [Synechococcus sp. RSCCF101]|uniref:hypothetical protein n=1 Tax=Synechococcus sp. RSCCF101 TaxID=2511069 RepID=UPI001244DB15|nr:hypothetical protein [Synechococcus sp. RSCCF101]QEY31149.1 hypothetical protein EVJ50_01665 [Synechococcus sp. RSCCF101]
MTRAAAALLIALTSAGCSLSPPGGVITQEERDELRTRLLRGFEQVRSYSYVMIHGAEPCPFALGVIKAAPTLLDDMEAARVQAQPLLDDPAEAPAVASRLKVLASWISEVRESRELAFEVMRDQCPDS